MSSSAEFAEVEASGETVGEAKWQALRELERLYPGIDRDSAEFQVISEGERGLLGVGTTPARVIARVDVRTASGADVPEESVAAGRVREAMERICDALGASARVVVTESEDAIRAQATAVATDAGLLIGRNGRTIDAVQYVVSAIAHREQGDAGTAIDVDAGGYRARRRERLAAVARRAAAQVVSSGTSVTLAPMTPVERRIVHLELQDVPGVETHSEGDEPTRRVVVSPSTA
jgi:spoIIIJ-associated protein